LATVCELKLINSIGFFFYKFISEALVDKEALLVALVALEVETGMLIIYKILLLLVVPLPFIPN
jgi:hypothetical protein